MCFDCKLRRAAERARRPLWWLLLAASALLLAFVLALMCVGAASAAPAPLARRQAATPAHPRWMCGRWTMWWCKIPYHYELLPDGTFRHELPPGSDRGRYVGTWRLHAPGVLHLTEQLVDRDTGYPGPGYLYELKCSDGWSWRHRRDEAACWMERHFNYQPLGVYP